MSSILVRMELLNMQSAPEGYSRASLPSGSAADSGPITTQVQLLRFSLSFPPSLKGMTLKGHGKSQLCLELAEERSIYVIMLRKHNWVLHACLG